MTQISRIPDIEIRKREVEQLRDCKKQLDLFTVALDEWIALVEVDLRQQQRARLQARQTPIQPLDTLLVRLSIDGASIQPEP